MIRFAYAFAGVATAAALTGGVTGLALGSSPTTAPTLPDTSVGAVQTEWTPAVTTPAVPLSNGPAAVPATQVTRTIVIREGAPMAKPTTPKATKRVNTPEEPNGQSVEQSAEPVAVEVDPTPSPTPPQSTGEPPSMHGQPDPQLGGVTPGDPTQTPPPLEG